jgi:phosphoglycerol transferase MdoB-like AlkP superfamily enzyme
MYANGNRSQQGIAAILGGFPALPITTLTAIPEKMRQTTTITSQFTENGYHTAFYYGGELRFANLKAYFIHNGFDEILGDGDWDSSIPKGKLGIHDEYMYTILEEKLSTAPTPFFVNFFTLSSHSPYDQPFPQRIDWNDTEDDYHNSVLYGDSCLGDFLTKAKASEWYANTLIVIVSDHSHQAYTHRPISTAEYRHIPMLITGGALAKHFRGKTFDQIASQVDIGKTLLNQLNFNSDSLFWSKDLMNPYSPKFAYFELNTGFGWISKDGYVAYDILNGIELQNTYNNDSLKEINYHYGKAYLQEVFQEFIDL